MEGNPYFPTLKHLACDRLCLSNDSIFSDAVREAVYSNEELWQQVWACSKRYNRITDASFAALLNLPFGSPAPQGKGKSSNGVQSQAKSNKRPPAAAAKKAAPKKTANVFALLAADGDDEDDDSSDKIQVKEPEIPVAEPPKRNTTRAAAPTHVAVLDAPFAIRRLDLSDLPFISETLIVQALQTYGSTITSLSLARCHQITHDVAKAIKASNMPLTKLILSGCRNVDDSFVELILPCMANLESLDIGVMKKKEYIAFRNHVEWDVMRYSDIRSPPKVTKISPSALASVTKSCPYLTHLNVSGHLIDDDEIVTIMENVRTDTLSSLDISFCSDHSDGVSTLGWSRCMPFITNIQHLKTEYVGWISYSGKTRNQPDRPEKLNLPSLETFWACKSDVSDGQLSLLTNLKSLNLSDILYANSLTNLLPHLTSLAPVNYGAFQGADDNIVYKLFAKATSLRELDAGGLVLRDRKILPFRLIRASPMIEKATFGEFLDPSIFPEEVGAPEYRFRRMKSLSFCVSDIPDAPVIEPLVINFPYVQKLDLSGSPAQELQSSQLSGLALFPFLKSFHMTPEIFTFRSSNDLKLLGRLHHLEKLSIAVTPACVAPFFARRHEFATKLRSLSIFIVANSVVFPKTLEIASKDIPEWCGSRPQQNLEMPDSVDPYAFQPLFPSLSEFSINKIGTLTSRLWSLLARDICPNVHTLHFIGDMNPARGFDPTDASLDQFAEEGKTEEVVMHALELWKSITSIHLVHCWKVHYIQPTEPATPPPPEGFFTHKYRFLKRLRDKNIAVYILFENSATYRAYGTLTLLRNKREAAGRWDSSKRNDEDLELYW